MPTGCFAVVLACLEKLDNLSPINDERKIEIGKIHIEKGEPEKAQQFFEEARPAA